MRLGSPSHASIGSPRERVLSQAVMVWPCLVVLAAVHSGCRAEFVQAVRTVNGLGGTVSFDQQGRLVAVDLARDRIDIAATDLERLAAFPHLKRLQLAGSSLGNAQSHCSLRQAP